MKKQAFPPIVNANSKVLILGTMPGEKSLQLQQYYGHRGNHFWKIVFRLFDHPVTEDYQEKKSLLLAKGIALWDVLEACEREGSSDAKILKEAANDFHTFHKKYPNIKTVFFASKKAEELYNLHVKTKPALTFYTLPSPSSANTWKTFDEKLAEWRVVLNHL